jgi:hypothetical protein
LCIPPICPSASFIAALPPNTHPYSATYAPTFEIGAFAEQLTAEKPLRIALMVRCAPKQATPKPLGTRVAKGNMIAHSISFFQSSFTVVYLTVHPLLST